VREREKRAVYFRKGEIIRRLRQYFITTRCPDLDARSGAVTLVVPDAADIAERLADSEQLARAVRGRASIIDVGHAALLEVLYVAVEAEAAR
jgi:hypothetical protein